MSTQTKPIKTRNHSGQQNGCAKATPAGLRGELRGPPAPSMSLSLQSDFLSLCTISVTSQESKPGQHLACVRHCYRKHQQVAVRNTPARNTASWLRPRNKSRLPCSGKKQKVPQRGTVSKIRKNLNAHHWELM